MWLFNKEEEEQTLKKRVFELEDSVREHRREITGLYMDIKDLRDKVLRKIQYKKEVKEEETKDIYSGMLLKE